jgi:hypothetical protein
VQKKNPSYIINEEKKKVIKFTFYSGLQKKTLEQLFFFYGVDYVARYGIDLYFKVLKEKKWF